MYFFHDNLVNYAVEYFKKQEFHLREEGDSFWGLFVPGNTSHFADRPFERFSDYEGILWRLWTADSEKYRRMHKGTPFYFMSWLAFDLRNYEKALFYIDACISEDIRCFDKEWKEKPGAQFLLLNPKDQVAERTVVQIHKLLTEQLDRFNVFSNQQPLSLGSSFQKFLETLLKDSAYRTIISAIYVFILEFGNHMRELTLREGSSGGSSQPFTLHLFTGGLLFESLLKYCYPYNEKKVKNATLGDIFRTPQFIQDFSLKSLETSAGTLNKIHAGIRGSNSIETAFTIAAKLRNTTGHNLVWDDIFDTPVKYRELFWQVMNALLYMISTKFI